MNAPKIPLTEEYIAAKELIEYLCSTTPSLHGKSEKILNNYQKMDPDDKNNFVLGLSSWGEQTEALLCDVASALGRIKKRNRKAYVERDF